MIVGKIWDYEYPWDVRVEKVTETLLDAGHEVHLFCRNRRAQPERERLGRLEVHRMPSWRRAGKWIDNVSSFPAFMNPRWVRHVTDSARRARVDLLLCRDLPLAPLALRVGRRLGLPVVVDIAENYPAMLRQLYNRKDFRIHNLLVRNPLLAAGVERYVFRRADAILVVVEESRDRLVAMGVPPERIEIVCNTPGLDRVQDLRQIAGANAEANAPLRLVYLGLLERDRGLDTVLHAIRRLRSRGVEVHFDVIGEDKASRLQELSASLGIGDHTRFHGYVPYAEALTIVAAADAGVVPHHVTEHWSTTIPNKLFDYMASGLPVLVSSAPPAQRIVEETGCGLCFRDRDADHLADQIQRLLPTQVRREMGEAGVRAVSERYNWTHDGARLIHRLESVVEEWYSAAEGRGVSRAVAAS